MELICSVRDGTEAEIEHGKHEEIDFDEEIFLFVKVFVKRKKFVLVQSPEIAAAFFHVPPTTSAIAFYFSLYLEPPHFSTRL